MIEILSTHKKLTKIRYATKYLTGLKHLKTRNNDSENYTSSNV